MILEIIILTIITFLGVAFVLFYFVGKTGSSKTRYLEYLMDNPGVYGLIYFIPTLLAVTLLLFFKNRNYVIGYHFDDATNTLLLKYRGLVNKELKDIRVLYNEISIQDFNEKKFLFNQTYRGKSITVKSANLTLDFVTNNFIWEDQPREKNHFIQELERIKKLD